MFMCLSCRFIHVPAIIIIGLLGLAVDVPSFTIIAIIKSPLLLVKGWQRLTYDLISRQGPFLETACIPIAGLTILLWPLFVIGTVAFAIFASIFVGLYGSIIVYQVYIMTPLIFVFHQHFFCLISPKS